MDQTTVTIVVAAFGIVGTLAGAVIGPHVAARRYLRMQQDILI